MKILITSDSHDHIANLKSVMEIGKRAGVGAVIHCGDWDSTKSIEAVLTFKIPLYSILGNADVEDGIEDYLKFNATKFESNFLKFEIDGRRIGLIHNLKKHNDYSNLDIVFNGHYHSKDEKMINFTKFVRPGAIVNGLNFAIYETANNEIEFFEDND